MADDNEVEIRFSASADDALDGHCGDPCCAERTGGAGRDLGGSLGRWARIRRRAPDGQAASGGQGLCRARAGPSSALQIREIGAEIKILQLGLAEQKMVLNAEASQFQITQNQKFALLEAETEKEYEAELGFRNKSPRSANLASREARCWSDRMARTGAKTGWISGARRTVDRAARGAVDGYLSTVQAAFNSQLRGLLEGTTSWPKAMKIF